MDQAGSFFEGAPRAKNFNFSKEPEMKNDEIDFRLRRLTLSQSIVAKRRPSHKNEIASE